MHSPTPTPTLERVEIVDVTPELAKVWLESNEGNRRIKETNLDRLSQDLRNGEWRTTPDAIAFSSEGKLINGQHRLTAMAQTNIGGRVIVAHNLHPEAYGATDHGVKRTFGDLLKHHGYIDTNHLAACVKGVAGFIDPFGTTSEDGGGTFLSNRNLSQSRLFDILKEDEDGYLKALDVGVRLSKTTKGSTAKVWTSTFYMFDKVDSEYAEDFATCILTAVDVDGMALPARHPAVVLRERFITEFGKNDKPLKKNSRHATALIIKAWNAFVKGEEMGQIRFRLGGSKPEIFPVILVPSEL